jgi:amino acid transporter
MKCEMKRRTELLEDQMRTHRVSIVSVQFVVICDVKGNGDSGCGIGAHGGCDKYENGVVMAVVVIIVVVVMVAVVLMAVRMTALVAKEMVVVMVMVSLVLVILVIVVMVVVTVVVMMAVIMVVGGSDSGSRDPCGGGGVASYLATDVDYRSPSPNVSQSHKVAKLKPRA